MGDLLSLFGGMLPRIEGKMSWGLVYACVPVGHHGAGDNGNGELAYKESAKSLRCSTET